MYKTIIIVFYLLSVYFIKVNGDESSIYTTASLILKGRYSKPRVSEKRPEEPATSLTTMGSHTLLCGLNLVMYDTKTHKCENNKVVMIASRTRETVKHTEDTATSLTITGSNTLLCGDFVRYNTKTHKCENGTIVTIRSTVNPTTRRPITWLPERSITTRKEISESPPIGPNNVERPCSGSDVIDCNGKLHCGNNGTFRCCGFQIFRPEKQTCCRETSAKYRIYNNKPEINHICCGINVYPRRSSKAPCQHSSRNDAFLSGKLPKMKKHILDSMLCNGNVDFAYHLRVKGPFSRENERYLTAKVTQYKQRENLNTHHRYFIRMESATGNIKIPLDKYSPSRLRRKSFLILSNFEYGRILLLRQGDVVFKAPKQKRILLKKIRKVQANCTKK